MDRTFVPCRKHVNLFQRECKRMQSSNRRSIVREAFQKRRAGAPGAFRQDKNENDENEEACSLHTRITNNPTPHAAQAIIAICIRVWSYFGWHVHSLCAHVAATVSAEISVESHRRQMLTTHARPTHTSEPMRAIFSNKCGGRDEDCGSSVHLSSAGKRSSRALKTTSK